jgi:hypothetical protein
MSTVVERLIEASDKSQSYLDRVPKFSTENEALEAVRRNGDALRYVKEQSEAVCLEAVKEDGDALQYVDIEKFNNTIGETK